jgi:hypothetical protein
MGVLHVCVCAGVGGPEQRVPSNADESALWGGHVVAGGVADYTVETASKRRYFWSACWHLSSSTRSFISRAVVSARSQ